MALPYRHERVAPNLHRFVFPSESRSGKFHEVLLDLEASGPDRLSCLCEAAMYGKFCKHKRAIVRGAFGRKGFGRTAVRWIQRRAASPSQRRS